MEEKQMRIILNAIQRATLDNDSSKAGAIAALGLAMLNGTETDATEAWASIQELTGSSGKPR